MRKTIIASNGYASAALSQESTEIWLDLVSIAHVEITSEDARYPVEDAFDQAQGGALGKDSGWQAATLGPQTVRLRFVTPQTITRVQLHFRERVHERSQEFSLVATLEGGRAEEIVRQQWSFSPGGSIEEQESYGVNLEKVIVITLWIDPDRGRDRYPATLRALRIRG